ncbi:MAG: penicillin-binding protein activator, partial [Pseudomonadota bacterium]|nr:penicillin-binding protein activator [Pseudomonadota bacterium]
AFVVGPLTKEDVAAVAPLSAGHTPVLALNFLAETANSPHNFYQFALLPEDEARIVARRLAAEGKLKGVSIVPQGEWGSRIGSAFADEFSRLGGTVVDTGRYESGRADFSDTITRTLQVHGGKGDPATHRGDAAFIFLAGTPGAERLMLSQLKFHYAGDIPVYSTSDGFEPGSGANGDLDGLSFPDMPWMVSADAATARIRDLVRGTWPSRTARRDRLFAFGFDAYRLVPALRSNTLNGPGAIAGVTGRLRLDDHDRIRRDLDWAQIRNGEAAPL